MGNAKPHDLLANERWRGWNDHTSVTESVTVIGMVQECVFPPNLNLFVSQRRMQMESGKVRGGTIEVGEERGVIRHSKDN